MITRRHFLTRTTGAAAASTLGFPAITSCAATADTDKNNVQL
jgi:hypothetical protein